MRRIALLASLLLALPAALAAQPHTYTRADSLRGSIGPGRAWWDAAFYDLHVKVSPADSSISGWNGITYRVLQPGREMQIDLQMPLVADSIVQDGRRLAFRRDGNAFFVAMPQQAAGTTRTLRFYYHGRPRVATHAPWDGGFVWGADSTRTPWIATAVQGLGASAWWPNKDTQADEPDSQRVAITVPRGISDVSNGRLRSTRQNADGTATFEWFVANPINNYDVAVNAAAYAHFSDSYAGEGGNLTLDFWPLAYHESVARRQFQQVKPMLKCFEHWFGPYPWYADGYKLVETPHLGMEHQSAVAYGNHYLNGYLGRDLSQTGLGLQWDFIIVHESAHEWWGNNITSTDLADMWVHESFANYAEGLYTECQQGKEAGAKYVIGTRAAIQNDEPIIPAFGVNAEGSGDMYYKGGNLLHTLRQIVGDDEKWRGILRGLNSTFRHQTVTGIQVREYISRQSGIDFSRVFQQYLETTKIPVLEYQLGGSSLRYRWANVVPGFDMPVKVRITGDAWTMLRPTTEWQTAPASAGTAAAFAVDPNFYVEARDLNSAAAK
ncbi:M1 family metallopeptidase [Longimicrobium sp.]|uniref:M1 family metallopeptidase n=1 Tax=Longimicrobium sp. TaxID=2029185 RepID=UPI002C6922D1|nr:M1 family metallopeptidase [Longimicrobium sp.]HSU15558.1 M1 family metallopeptidase [Longimicrobium sp.]